jgi:hypothetical protein
MEIQCNEVSNLAVLARIPTKNPVWEQLTSNYFRDTRHCQWMLGGIAKDKKLFCRVVLDIMDILYLLQLVNYNKYMKSYIV